MLEIQDSSIKAEKKYKMPSDQKGRVKTVSVASDVKLNVENPKELKKKIKQTRDFFVTTGDAKGTFLAKLGTIKDRNGKDLTEAEDIKKRKLEYTK